MRIDITHGLLVKVLAVALTAMGLFYFLRLYSLVFEPFYTGSVLVVVVMAGNFWWVPFKKRFGDWLRIAGAVGIQIACLYVYLDFHHEYLARRALDFNSRNRVAELGKAVLSYAERDGRLPMKDTWFDDVMAMDTSEHRFSLRSVEGRQYGMAFNRDLSGLAMDDVRPETVLLVEAAEFGNFAGGSELLWARFDRREYYPARDRCVYLFFADGTLAKYRIRDGALALYDSDEERFAQWLREGETEYLPLRWEK